jgi:hypothetical protein
MKTHRSEQRIEAGGSLHLRALPFADGATVEVIVRPHTEKEAEPEAMPDRSLLRGAVKKYDEPTAPVAAQAWEVAH